MKTWSTRKETTVMSRLLTALWCSTLLLVCPSTGRAGSNAGGSVELSWDASALRSSPSASGQRVFPLYLSLKDISDLSQLALHLSWTPYDPTGECVRVLPAGTTATCGS